MPVVRFRKDIQMKIDIIGFVLNVLKTLKTCCSASSTVHCHRQAELNSHALVGQKHFLLCMKTRKMF